MGPPKSAHRVGRSCPRTLRGSAQFRLEPFRLVLRAGPFAEIQPGSTFIQRMHWHRYPLPAPLHRNSACAFRVMQFQHPSFLFFHHRAWLNWLDAECRTPGETTGGFLTKVEQMQIQHRPSLGQITAFLASVTGLLKEILALFLALHGK